MSKVSLCKPANLNGRPSGLELIELSFDDDIESCSVVAVAVVVTVLVGHGSRSACSRFNCVIVQMFCCHRIGVWRLERVTSELAQLSLNYNYQIVGTALKNQLQASESSQVNCLDCFHSNSSSLDPDSLTLIQVLLELCACFIHV